MTELIDRYLQACEGSHPHKAIVNFSKEEAQQILLHYYNLCRPLKVNCRNVNHQQQFEIESMARAYNHIFKGANVLPLKTSACALPGSITRAGQYLAGIGLTTDKFIDYSKL